MEAKELIDFKFEWKGKDYDKIAPNVVETAKKLLELKLIRVKSELNEKGNIIIEHTGVCRKQGLIESIATGIVNENIYSYKFSTSPEGSLNNICKGREESKSNFCKMSACPIMIAGYLYYLKYRNDSKEQVVEEFMKDATDVDIYARNYNELKKLELDKELEEFISPLSLPAIKTLRGNFIGEEGVDTDTVLNKYAQYLYRIGKIENPTYTSVKLFELASKGENFDNKHLYVIQEINEGLSGLNNEVLKAPTKKKSQYSDNEYKLENALKALRTGRKGKYIIINATPLELKKLFLLDAKLPYIFDQTIYFKDYKDEELLKYFKEELPDYHKNLIKNDFDKSFLSYLDRNRRYFPFKNKDLSIFLAGYTARKNEIILPKERYDESSLETITNNLIGMENIKKELEQLKLLFSLKKKLNKLNIEISNLNLHMMFLGNPGTGKTTVARMISKILFDFGYIRENKLIEVSRQDLVAEFLGQTAIKTNKAIERAMGGILFIDEAYSLKTNSNDSYGDEAISTLIKAMEDFKNDFVVIFAGYSKEMQEFIHANSGIKSRIGYTFEFADYTVDELYEIFELKMRAINFSIEDEATKKAVMNLLSSGKNRKNFGNGRFVDNILQKILIKHSSIEKMSDKNITKLTKQSIPTYDEVMSYSSGIREPDKIEEIFDDIIGMKDLKKQLIGLGNYIKFKKEINKTDGKTLPDINLHMMFLGNPGTGKTTIARKVTKMLYDLDCIRINKLVEVDRKDLIGEHAGETPLKVGKVIEGAKGGVLFIDEAYSLKLGPNDVQGSEAIATLIKEMEDNKDEIVVIFAGYTKEMQEFIHANSGIKSRIGYTIEFADYNEEELYAILELKLKKCGFEIEKKVIDEILELLKFGRNKKDFGNGRFVDKLLMNILKKHSEHYTKENIFIIGKKDIPTIDELINHASGERKPKKVDELFNDIIGMENIKQQVLQLRKYIEFRNELLKVSSKNLPDMRLHMLFIGDAGTGKTTMARKITEMLYNIGCIRINKLVEVERKDLVGQYMGETAPKTEKVIEEALGGVLFIDEAYSLTPKDSAKDFGQEAITTLIKAMEDHRDELIVIFAGYTKEMKEFVNSNSGIASRIGYTFKFENYNEDDLYKIFELKCSKYSLKINKEVKEKVMDILKFFHNVENFGNGRFVDKLLQEILIQHSLNEKLLENINVLMVEDIPTIEKMVEITFNNRENVIIPSDVSEEDRKRVAIHELGHAIITYIYTGKSTLQKITVVPEGIGTLGYVIHTTPKDKICKIKRDWLNEVEIKLAGRAAEDVFYGEDNISSGCSNDLDEATRILTRMLKAMGMSETLGLISCETVRLGLEMEQKLDVEKKKVFENCYENVKKVLKDNMQIFNKVLKELMKKGTLTGKEFINLIKEKDGGK